MVKLPHGHARCHGDLPDGCAVVPFLEKKLAGPIHDLLVLLLYEIHILGRGRDKAVLEYRCISFRPVVRLYFHGANVLAIMTNRLEQALDLRIPQKKTLSNLFSNNGNN
jgi:hypothetical protein